MVYTLKFYIDIIIIMIIIISLFEEKNSAHLIFSHSIEWMAKLQYRQQSKLQFREKSFTLTFNFNVWQRIEGKEK